MCVCVHTCMCMHVCMFVQCAHMCFSGWVNGWVLMYARTPYVSFLAFHLVGDRLFFVAVLARLAGLSASLVSPLHHPPTLCKSTVIPDVCSCTWLYVVLRIQSQVFTLAQQALGLLCCFRSPSCCLDETPNWCCIPEETNINNKRRIKENRRSVSKRRAEIWDFIFPGQADESS